MSTFFDAALALYTICQCVRMCVCVWLPGTLRLIPLLKAFYGCLYGRRAAVRGTGMERGDQPGYTAIRRHNGGRLSYNSGGEAYLGLCTFQCGRAALPLTGSTGNTLIHETAKNLKNNTCLVLHTHSHAHTTDFGSCSHK